MNKTILQGKWRQARGSLKTQWGDLTDDDRRMLDGKIEQMTGLFQERYGYTKIRATHALKRYMRRHGKRVPRDAAKPFRNWLPVVIGMGVFALIATGAYALAHVVSTKCQEVSNANDVQGNLVSPEAPFE
jgi:uncharacterized protein YjbJ (UPF0337 family)